MRSRLVAAVAALAALVPLACGQDKKEPAKAREDRQAQVEELVQDFLKARKEADEAFRGARTDRERAAAEAKLPREADFLPRIHKLIAGDAKDDAAGEALALAVFGFQTKDEKVYDALARNFVKTDRIQRFVQMAMAGAPDAAKPVLANVLADNPSKALKGMACFALGAIAFEKDDPKAAKEAEVYFGRVEKEFADVTVGRGDTLGEMAKGSLYELRHLQVGMKAPAAESKNLKGEKATLADYKGKVVVLDVWATWCVPCKEMIPHEREMVEKFKNKPFALISVSADDEKKELEEFLGKESMPWAHWWDGPDAPFLKQWNVHTFPTIYVIDAKGVIRYKHVRGEDLEKAVEKLLAEVK
jgi:thiol-disulfide isomerase/thioredoxin